MKKTYSFFILFLLLVISSQAQEKRALQDLIYADAKFGFMIFPDDAGVSTRQITASVGYRITPGHGIGIGYHDEAVGGAYTGTSFRGIGMDYRFATRNGFIFKAGGGIILSGGQYEDTPRRFEYIEGGTFLDFSVDYQLRPGITFGLYFSRAKGMEFDAYTLKEFSLSGVETYSGVVDGEQANLGLSVGFAFPWRGKK